MLARARSPLLTRPRLSACLACAGIGLAALGCRREASGKASFEPATADAQPRPAGAPNESARGGETHPTSTHISVASVTKDRSVPEAWAPAALVPDSGAPRVYAKTRFAWIRSEPSASSEWIGYLWLGGSVPLRKAQPRSGPGCSVLWQPVEPRGYMCPNGITATLDASDPAVVAVAPYRPRLESPWPHRYGEIHERTERYEALPDERTERTRERYRSRHLEQIARVRRGAAPDPSFEGVDFSPAVKTSIPFPRLPFGVTEGRTSMPRRSALAYTDEVETRDRTFLLAADMSWVPKDYVRPYPRSEFHGVALDPGEARVAFFRESERPSFVLDAEGRFTEGPVKFQRLSHVALTGARKEAEGEAFLETKDGGLWLRERDAVVPELAELTPWRAKVGAPDTTGRAPRGRATWIEVSILGGWLIAYEGTFPRFSTMISAGHGGSAEEGRDPLENAATPTGTFSINGKFATATMESSSGLVHADVPWTQNFVGPYAVHAAYWHDDFGNLRSGGCVNVSPRDGKWLFDFTEPSLPAGWHGVRSGAGASTAIVLHD